jgi:energy-coupling factor transport system permease protein
VSRLLERWNPLTPLALAVLLVVITYVAPQPWGPVGALLLALALAAASGIGTRVLGISLAAGVPTLALLFLMNAIVAPVERAPMVERFTLAYAPTREALFVALRLTSAVAALSWVIGGIPPRRLTSALAQRGLPSWAAYVIVAALEAVPLARRRAAEVLEAQRCRGLRVGGGLRGRLRALVPLAGPLIVSLVSETEERALALDARGFVPGRRRTSMMPIADPPSERSVRALLWLACLLLVGWRIARGLAG